MSEDTIEFNTKGLDQLIKALNGKLPVIRVGILGGKDVRTRGSAKSNAAVGVVHEFGTTTHPRRSFLRIPLTENLQKYLEKSGAFDEDLLKEVVKMGQILPWLKKIAVTAEKIVAEGFATGGFGKWPKWKTPGYENNTGQILVDTQQLRNSITSDIK